MTRELPDEDLLTAWRAGDLDAGDELVRRYFDGVSRFFRTKIGVEAEDLIQRTFLDCVESRDRVRGGFRGYLFAVARNRLLDHLRSRYRRAEHLDPETVTLVDLGTSPSQRVARNEREALLAQALAVLPIDLRIALELAYWEGLDGPEIARVLDVPANTVRGRLARAREALRSELERLADSPRVATDTLRTFRRGSIRLRR